jgi:co-chaperonin GroES (HSP10)
MHFLVEMHKLFVSNRYYFSPNGNNSNSGTSLNTPWQTTDKVSSINLKAGDCLLFEGGKTFDGMIWIDISKDTSNSINPITISSYGVGKAKFLAINNPSIYINSLGNINIENIAVYANGLNSNSLNGISISNYSSNISGINIKDIEVFGFGGFGLEIGSYTSGFNISKINISDSKFYANGKAGLITHGIDINSIQNLKIDNVRVYDNLGILTAITNTGDGIVISNTSNSTVKNSQVFNNGQNCKAKNCASGILVHESDKIIIEKNYVYNNKTGIENDGNGIDLDNNTSNSIVQYNYTWNNDGPGYMIYDYTSDLKNYGNVIRYNISYNDGKKSNMPNLAIGGFVNNFHVYNNTIFATLNNANSPIQIWNFSGTNSKIENNILYKSGYNGFVLNVWNSDTSKLMLSHNNYFGSEMGARILWNYEYFTNYQNWSLKTSQDKYGLITNPMLKSDMSPMLNSPVINNGKLITNLFDYYDSIVPTGNKTDIGAVEFQGL